MKRRDFLQHLALHHCTILREGRSHTIIQNNINNLSSTVATSSRNSATLVKVICKQLDIPKPY